MKPSGKKSDPKNCIFLACCASFHPQIGKKETIRNHDRISHYRPYFNQINETNLTTPLRSNQLTKFEQANPGICLNLFAIDETSKNGQKIIYPCRISDQREQDKKIINLLILPKKNEDDHAYHVVLITDLDRLIRPQATGDKRKYWACPFCMVCLLMKEDEVDQTDGQMTQTERIALHKKLCSKKDAMQATYPPANSKLAFSRIDASVELSHLIYFDCETRETKRMGPDKPPEVALPPEAPRVHSWVRFESENTHLRGDPRSEVKKRQQPCRLCTATKPCCYIRDSNACLTRLELFSLGYQVVHTHPQESKFEYREYFGEEEINLKFLSDLKRDLREIKRRQQINVPLKMTSKEWAYHMQIPRCQLCDVE